MKGTLEMDFISMSKISLCFCGEKNCNNFLLAASFDLQYLNATFCEKVYNYFALIKNRHV